MQVGIIERGQIWANIARRLLRHGREAIVCDRAVAALAQQGAAPGLVVVELVRKLGKPRASWLTPPAGELTPGAIRVLEPGVAVIDGGNALWKDDIRRAAALKPRCVHDIDVATSGDASGPERRCCLTMGGEKQSVDGLDRIFTDLAPEMTNVPAFSGRDGRDLRIDCSYIHPGSRSAGQS
jgi:6-phosphogluconate dehydrogenase